QVKHGLEGLGRGHRRSLPFALVVRTGERITLRVNLPVDRADHELDWRLEDEEGTTHAGKLVPLPATKERAAIAADTTRVEREFVLPLEPSEGYHRLALTNLENGKEETLLIVAPGSCFRPSVLEDGRREWGPSVQLYGLRSERNWGIGDFSDLAPVAEQWITRGASLVAVSPLHALFPHNPAHASPYSPSSRLFLNALYIDVEAIEDFRESAEARSLFASPQFQEALARVRTARLVDYPAVARLKWDALEIAYRHFRHAHVEADDARASAFRAFCVDGGDALRRHALFEALQEHFFAGDASIHGWQAWPDAYRDPGSPEVERFAAERVERVE